MDVGKKELPCCHWKRGVRNNKGGGTAKDNRSAPPKEKDEENFLKGHILQDRVQATMLSFLDDNLEK